MENEKLQEIAQHLATLNAIDKWGIYGDNEYEESCGLMTYRDVSEIDFKSGFEAYHKLGIPVQFLRWYLGGEWYSNDTVLRLDLEQRFDYWLSNVYDLK